MPASQRVVPASQHFEQARRAHAAADAHRDDDMLDAAALAFDERVPDEPRAGHAVRVADRDGAAVDIVLVRVDAELVAAIQGLAGERFVKLPQPDVVDGEAMELRSFGTA